MGGGGGCVICLKTNKSEMLAESGWNLQLAEGRSADWGTERRSFPWKVSRGSSVCQGAAGLRRGRKQRISVSLLLLFCCCCWRDGDSRGKAPRIAHRCFSSENWAHMTQKKKKKKEKKNQPAWLTSTTAAVPEHLNPAPAVREGPRAGRKQGWSSHH